MATKTTVQQPRRIPLQAAAADPLPPPEPLPVPTEGEVTADQALQPVSRANRRPFGARDPKLYWPPRHGFHRHWFNDVDDRIQSALQAAYSFVKDDNGRPVEKNVGNRAGQPMKSYLMELPMDLRELDLAERKKLSDELNHQVYSGTHKANPEDQRYVPKNGISVQSGTGTGRG